MRKIVVELTNRCNLNCRHCLLQSPELLSDLPLGLLARLLREARPEGFAAVAFTGGEPTLHPRFEPAVGLAVQAGYRFGFVTNGSGFPNLLGTLDRYREHLEVITFSLDGSTEAGHEWLRGPGSYRRLMQAISVCVVQNLPFTLNTIITRRNYEDLEAIAELASQLGSRGLRYGHLVPTPRTASWNLELPPLARKLADARIRLLGGNVGIPVALAPGGHTTDLFPCGPLRSEEVSVDCRNNLIWCCQFSNGQGPRIGNLGDTGFAKLMGRLALEQERFRQAKIERLREGEFQDSDFFPCTYCSAFFGKGKAA